MEQNQRKIEYLSKISSPKDVKALSEKEILALAEEIRGELVRIVSNNGGHLASNLGIVEITMAIHRVFDTPADHVIFDVGHQSYVHKILTGRADKFSTFSHEEQRSIMFTEDRPCTGHIFYFIIYFPMKL